MMERVGLIQRRPAPPRDCASLAAATPPRPARCFHYRKRYMNASINYGTAWGGSLPPRRSAFLTRCNYAGIATICSLAGTSSE